MNPSICVLILNYKTYELTISFVETLFLQKKIDLTVLVVDNKSENGSFKYMLDYFQKYVNVEVIESEWNGGYAYGNNYGLKYIQDRDIDYILVSNNDIEIKDELTLHNLAVTYKVLDNPALISPVQHVDNKINSAAWKQPTFFYDFFTNVPFINKLVLKQNIYDIKNSKTPIKVDVLPGSFFFFEKSIIYDIGLLDEETFLYGEERILSYKVKEHNLQNYLITDLCYEHMPSSTISSNVTKLRMLEMAHKSILYYHKQYLKTSNVFIYLLTVVYKLIENRYK